MLLAGAAVRAQAAQYSCMWLSIARSFTLLLCQARSRCGRWLPCAHGLTCRPVQVACNASGRHLCGVRDKGADKAAITRPLLPSLGTSSAVQVARRSPVKRLRLLSHAACSRRRAAGGPRAQAAQPSATTARARAQWTTALSRRCRLPCGATLGPTASSCAAATTCATRRRWAASKLCHVGGAEGQAGRHFALMRSTVDVTRSIRHLSSLRRSQGAPCHNLILPHTASKRASSELTRTHVPDQCFAFRRLSILFW